MASDPRRRPIPPPPPPPPPESDESIQDPGAANTSAIEEQKASDGNLSQESAKPDDVFKLKFCTVCASNNNR